MNLDWLTQPFVQDVILGVGLLGSLMLWITAKLESRAIGNALRAFRQETEGAINDIGAKLVELQETPEAPQATPAPISVQGLNLTTRTKALRMHGRGESVATIAAALQVQREEIELLLKLDSLFDATAQ